jgi:hypothetical protein
VAVLVANNVSTQVNEYRAGVAMLAYPNIPAILPALRRAKRLRIATKLRILSNT